MAESLSVSASASLAVSRSRILSVFSLAETEAPSSACLMALMSSASDVRDFISADAAEDDEEDPPGDGENSWSWTEIGKFFSVTLYSSKCTRTYNSTSNDLL